MRQKERTALISMIKTCLASAEKGNLELVKLRLQVIKSYLVQKGKK